MAKNSDSQQDAAFNPLDLSQLKDLSFGPDWASEGGRKQSEQFYRDHDGGERRRFRDRGSDAGGARRSDGGQQGGGGNRDRRGPGGAPRPGGAPGDARPERSGDRRERRGGFDSRDARQAQPVFEPVVDVIFVSQDQPFDMLLKAMRTTFKTYELFEIARIVLSKENRFVAIVSPKEGGPESKLFVCSVDQVAFESKDAVVQHVVANHLEHFFVVEDVEIDPPKGNFLMVTRCKTTGELLAPPNFHRYQEILRDHHARNLSHLFPYEQFLSRLESVKDAEVVQQWLDKMRKTRQYTLRQKEGDESPKVVLNALEDVKYYLLTERNHELFSLKDKVRVPGETIASLPDGNIRRSIERELELQRRFPLVTSNHLRGRLRRCNLSFFKRGAKGVTFVSAVKRKPRYKDTVFSASIDALLQYIEARPNIQEDQLLAEYLPAGVEAVSEESSKAVAQDLRWLVGAGYVTAFGNGVLQAEKVLSYTAAEDPNRGQQQASSDFGKKGRGRRSKKGGSAAAAGAPAVAQAGVEELTEDEVIDDEVTLDDGIEDVEIVGDGEALDLSAVESELSLDLPLEETLPELAAQDEVAGEVVEEAGELDPDADRA
jgi:hypothetical protein